MYISDLHLHGFKSFAYKTHVRFDNGITAIVGPNGCGKSNIVDALRWVLGEQRPTLLRSSSMSNVIFNGTAKKKALGMADVSLTFVNNKGILPVEYSELTISRRLYRSGESEYLINNTPCRLRDIMDLFMDTGMSSDAYSVIELKMVEEILNDRNNDRRHLFEEAAGVTRYKEKRRQTLRKLDETLNDLMRVEDILVEIRKKTRSLELQAQKAAKAKKYRFELETLDKAYTLQEYSAIQGELDPLQVQINNAEKEKKGISEKLAELEAAEEQARTRLLEKEKHEADVKRRFTQLQTTIRELETTLQITKEKIINEENVIRQHRSDIEQSKIDLKELEELKAASENRLAAFSDEKEKSEKALGQSKETFTDVQQKYAGVRHELYEIDISISNVNQKLTGLQSSRIKLESKLESSEDDELRILRDIENFEDEIANARGESAIIKKKSDEIYADIEQQEQNLQYADENRAKLEMKREILREEIRTLKSSRDAVISEVSLLQHIAESNEALPGSVSYLIQNHASDFSILTTAGDVFHTTEEKSAALEAALGDAVNFIITGTFEEAKEGARLLRSHNKGRAAFIPLQELKGTYPAADGSIVEHVQCEEQFMNAARLLLGNTIYADSLDKAIEKLINGGSSAVTQEGEYITAEKILKSGSKNEQAGIRLGLKDKLEKLAGKRSETEAALHRKEQALAALNNELQAIDLDQIRRKIKNLQKTAREHEQAISRHQSGISVYEKNIAELVTRKEMLTANRSSASEELETLQPQQKELQQRITSLHSEQNQKKNILEKLEEERAIAQNRFNDARLKHQDLNNKTENLSKDIRRAESGIANIVSRLQTRNELLGLSHEKIEEFKQQIAEAEKELSRSREIKKSADAKLEEAERASSIQRGQINELEKELRDLRRKKEVNLELVHHLTMAREKFELQAQRLADHIWETYALLMKQLNEQLPEDMGLAKAKERIGFLRQKLHRIGDVNPLAIDEFKEEKERLDFYESQIADLHQAEKEMRETIREINRTATERFDDTFEKIRQNFQHVFHTLFHEDDYCDLLIEENAEDPLEAKIEIRANPRGKRPSGINQLSGGEKTLTAIALLFAIYLVKPSPFCVLDEVDAPLDDANIERFSDMLRKFSSETQFIIITHNKKTMSKAEMMYGVTMPETGVSRLVGVRLDEVAEV
jgi:chromosome segregation protein